MSKAGTHMAFILPVAVWLMACSEALAQKPAATDAANPPPGMKTHVDKERGFSINYPADWRLRKNPNPNAVAAISSPKDEALVVVLVTEREDGADLADWGKAAQEHLTQSVPDYKLIEKADVKASDVPGVRLSYSGRMQGNVHGRSINLLVAHKTRGYVVMGMVPDPQIAKFAGAMKSVVDSFAIGTGAKAVAGPPAGELKLGAPFVSKEGGFQIRFPDGWEKAKAESAQGTTVVTFTNPGADAESREVITVLVNPAKGKLAEVVAEVKEGMSTQLQEFELLSEKEDKLDKITARRLVYNGTWPQGRFHVTQMIAVAPGRAYSVTMIVPMARAEACDALAPQVLASFTRSTELKK